MKSFWNSRYAEKDYAYGKEPNQFLKEQLSGIPPGKILFPAEGEGRNAVYAAELGWEVYAFDQSSEAKTKALLLAKERGVEIHYEVCDLNDYELKENYFDAVALIFVHLPEGLRRKFHESLIGSLSPGGLFLLEAFSEQHLQFNEKNPSAGGPRSKELLFNLEDIREDVDPTEISLAEEKVLQLSEGKYHLGESAVIRCVARKKA